MPEVTSNTISGAWLSALRLASAAPRKEVSNLVVNIDGLGGTDDLEDRKVRNAFDASLGANDDFSIATVSNTIFPASLWRPNSPRAVLFSRYLKLWPRLKDVKQNRRGTYFQRLISYPDVSETSFNQLEFVISAYRRGIRRRSALQCSILAPSRDLNATPFQGFPCMQQLAFIPEDGDGLRITALYPMQYLWARAYGNYLGLVRLGRFMGSEMGLELRGVTCIALVAKLEQPKLAIPFVEMANAV